MNPTALTLAIDVGGTSIKGELVDASGAVLGCHRVPTPGPAEAVHTISDVGRTLLNGSPGPVVGAAVVVPGIVDMAAGIARYSANIGWRDLPLAERLTLSWDLPVRIGHDVAAAAVAELRLGAAHGVDNAAFLVIGTGIAAALSRNGRLAIGHERQLCEIGHLVVRPGTRCDCGGDGCLEAVASARAIAAAYTEATGTAVRGAEEVLARVGIDPTATAVWSEAVEALADAVVALALLVGPEVIVIGGGLASAGPRLLDPLRLAVDARSRILAPPEIVPAALGERAGVVGADLLARTGWPELP